MPLILRITTVSLSLKKLLTGQLDYVSQFGYTVQTASLGGYNYANHHEISKLRRAISPLNDLIALFQLITVIIKVRPQIVHTHTPKAGLLGMMAAWFCRVPVRMHTVAGLPLMEKKGTFKLLLIWMERLTYFFATGVYPNSRGLETYIHQNISRSEKINVLGKGTSNGINLEEFNRDVLSEPTKNKIVSSFSLENKLVFLFIGRLVRDKGIIELVNAFTQLQQKTTNVKLLLVGPQEPEIDPLPKETLELLQKNSNIIETGYQEDVRPYIAVSDILVFPSYREGFPNVPLQCAAFRKAMILSDINGCNEIVEHKKSGLLVPPKDIDALYHAMVELAQDDNKRKEYGEVVYRHIKENFEQNTVWEALKEEYELQLIKAGINVS